MDSPEIKKEPENKTGKRSEACDKLANEALENESGARIQKETNQKSNSACQYLPALELSGLETEKDEKPFEQQRKEYQERLNFIENTRLVEGNHERSLKLGISNSLKEIESSTFMDGLLGNKERRETELKHRQEELVDVERGRNSAQKAMNAVSPDIARVEELDKREKQERQHGDIEKAEQTAKEAQAQMQKVMEATEGVAYIKRGTLENSGTNRQAELVEVENFKENLKTTKVIADTVRDGAVAGAAMAVSGGTLAPVALQYGVGLATVSAIGAGTAAGTGVGAVSRLTEATSDIYVNNKDPKAALTEAAINTIQDAKTALITSTSTLAGLGISSKLSTNLTTQSAALKSISGGAIAGGTEASVSTGLSTSDTFTGAKIEFDKQNANLAPEDRENRWEEFKRERKLTAGDIIKQSFIDVTTGAIAGAVGGRVEIGKQASSTASKKLWTAADLTSDAAITAGSAELSAAMDGRQVTGEDLAGAATGTLTGRLVGGMAAKANTEHSNKPTSADAGGGHQVEPAETPTDLYQREQAPAPESASQPSSLVDQMPLPHDRNKLQEMRKALVTDHISGLLNQEGTHTAIDAGLQKAVKEKSPYTLIGIDLNGLKEFNDTYGHKTGDLALKAAGDYLNDRLQRSSDVKGRLHGDEFLVGAAASEQQLASLKREMKDLKLAVEVKRDSNGNILKDDKGKVMTAGVRVVKPGDTLRPDETVLLNSGMSAGFQELTPELRQLSGPKLREEMERRADRNMYDTKAEKRQENEKLLQEVEASGKDLNSELKKKIESTPATEFKLSENSRNLSERLKEGAGQLRNAIPVELARPLYARRLEDSATKVPETGLLKKWAADQRSENLIKAAARENPPMPVTLVSMDLDGLKNLNDNYGHDAGSQMITAFGQWLNKRGRATDVVSHPYGADEFEITALNARPEQLQAFKKQLDGLRFVGQFSDDGKNKSVSGIRVLGPSEELAKGEAVIPYAGVSVGIAAVKMEHMHNSKEALARAQGEADHNVLRDKERRLEEGKRIPRKQN